MVVHDEGSRDPAVAGADRNPNHEDLHLNGTEAQPASNRLTTGRLRRLRSRKPTGLWRHADFVRFWAAHTASQFGSHVTLLALPLAAVLTLDASPGQMGLLAAAERLPFLLFGLFAGVWVDRRRRRPLLVGADLGRAVLLALIPLGALVGFLRIELLYAVALLAGTLTLLFDVAYVAYLPALVRRDQLVEGNSKLEASYSAAQAAGPGLAGILVGLATAPIAIAVDAVSYLVSAALLVRIRAPEPAPETTAGTDHPIRGVFREIGEGLRLVLRHPLLRAITACGVTTSFFGYVFLVIYVLYMSRELGLGPATIGIVLTAGGFGAFVGALLAGPAARWLGVGPAIIWAQVAFAVTGAMVPLAVVVPSVAVPLLIASEAAQWGVLTVYTVNQISLRQAIVPERLLGRVTATSRFLVTGSAPLGSLAGGALGGWIGLGPTLVVGAIGMMFAALWVAASPLRTLHAHPPHPDDLAPSRDQPIATPAGD